MDEAQRQSLLEEAGLGELVSNYENVHRVKFYWSADNSSFYVGFVLMVNISTEQIERIAADLDVPLPDVFLSVVAHELGHLEAYLLHLDWADELVAWELAEDILKDSLPSSWEALKANQMQHAGHVWNTRRILLDHSGLKRLDDLRTCLKCHVKNTCQIFLPKEIGYTSESGLLNASLSDVLFGCPACSGQFRARIRNGLITNVWELDKRDYFDL